MPPISVGSKSGKNRCTVIRLSFVHRAEFISAFHGRMPSFIIWVCERMTTGVAMKSRCLMDFYKLSDS